MLGQKTHQHQQERKHLPGLLGKLDEDGTKLRIGQKRIVLAKPSEQPPVVSPQSDLCRFPGVRRCEGRGRVPGQQTGNAAKTEALFLFQPEQSTQRFPEFFRKAPEKPTA